MAIYIPNLNLPENAVIVIDNKGQVWLKRRFPNRYKRVEIKAIEIPSHGRLIDADKIEWWQVTGDVTVGEKSFGKNTFVMAMISHINEWPTVIEAEGE